MILVHLVGPGTEPNPELMTIDYTNREYHVVLDDIRGVCFNGRTGFLGVPFCEIYVVKQRTWRRTAVVVGHELMHAAIWILGLPCRWNHWVDRTARLRRDDAETR